MTVCPPMPYRKSIDNLLTDLNSDSDGLDEAEVTRRLEIYGFNALDTQVRLNPFRIFIGQFKSFIIYILLFAVFFSLLIGEYVDSTIILIILILNALIGFFQEFSASKSLEALKRMTTIKAKVIRNGRQSTMDAKYIVPGDIVKLEAGDKVPADALIMQSVRLKVEEAALTGESLPAEKNNRTMAGETQIGDRTNMLLNHDQN